MAKDDTPAPAAPPKIPGARSKTPPPVPTVRPAPPTPIKKSVSSLREDKKNPQFQFEMGKGFVEDMSGGEFLTIMNEELPGPDFSREEATKAENFGHRLFDFEQVGERSFNKAEKDSYNKEDDLYPLICEPAQAIFDYAHEVRQKDHHLKMVITAYNPEKSSDGRKVDLTAYRSEHFPAFELSEEQAKKSKIPVSDARRKFLGRSAYSHAALTGEVKINPNSRVFHFDKVDDEGRPQFIRNDDAAVRIRGQVAGYLGEILERQPRVKVFSLFFYRDVVQLLVTDRTSTRISRPMNYVDNSDVLATFFYRFADGDDKARGYDTTVVRPSDEEAQMLHEKCSALGEGYLKRLVDDAMSEGLNHYSSPTQLHDAAIWPIRKVTVSHVIVEPLQPHVQEPESKPSNDVDPATDGHSTEVPPLHTDREEHSDDGPLEHQPDDSAGPAITQRQLLIGKPTFCSRDIHGRGTKGFVAFDLEKKDFVYLKDSWRLDSPTVHPEWETYQKLKAANVPNVGTMRYGGDVLLDPNTGVKQRTTTQRSGYGRFTARVQTRLVIEEVGRPLESYEEGKELVKTLLDSLKGHQVAWEKANVLHRDISDTNIVIVGEGSSARGILIDWDLCKYKHELVPNRPVSHGQRSGTYYFMSAVRARYPLKEAYVSDDIESFMHVTHYYGLRFHKHPLVGSVLTNHLQLYFKSSEPPSGRGSFPRFKIVRTGGLHSILTFEHPRLGRLLDVLSSICKEHYATFSEDDLRKWTPLECRETENVREENRSAPPAHNPLLARFAPSRAVTAQPTLNDHQLFILAFEDELATPVGWDSTDKCEDKFIALRSADGTHTICVSSHQPTNSNSSKRASREDSTVDPADAAPTAKRARMGEGSETANLPMGALEAVEEELELVD